jgi:hypothetical protein
MSNAPVSFNSPAMLRIRAVIANAGEPMSARQIAERAHISVGTAQHVAYLPSLLAAGMIHIVRYQSNGGGLQTPLYADGPGTGVIPERPRWSRAKQNAASRAWKERSGYQQQITAKNRLERAAERARRAPSMLALVAGAIR